MLDVSMAQRYADREDSAARQNENTPNDEQTISMLAAMVVPQYLDVIRDVCREMLTQLTEGLGGSAVASTLVRPANSEEEGVTGVAVELRAISENVRNDLLPSTSEDKRKSLARAVIELIVSPGATDVDVQRLAESFDNALTKLFRVPVAGQSPQELTRTFISLALFAVVVIDSCESCLKNPSITKIAQNVVVVGIVIYKVANKHGLFRWVQVNGGWHGLCTRIRDCIRQLTHRPISGNTNTDDHNTVNTLWPSNNTIILFGSLTVFVISYAYYKYRYR